MIKHIFISIAILSAIGLAACSHGASPNELFAAADSMMTVGDYNGAQKICDELQSYAFDNRKPLSVAQTGHLALLYLSLSEANENADQIDNITTATKCYMKAFEMAPDSAVAYFQNLTDANQIRMCSMLNFLANPSYDVPADHDSISYAAMDSLNFTSANDNDGLER